MVAIIPAKGNRKKQTPWYEFQMRTGGMWSAHGAPQPTNILIMPHYVAAVKYQQFTKKIWVKSLFLLSTKLKGGAPSSTLPFLSPINAIARLPVSLSETFLCLPGIWESINSVTSEEKSPRTCTQSRGTKNSLVSYPRLLPFIYQYIQNTYCLKACNSSKSTNASAKTAFWSVSATFL